LLAAFLSILRVLPLQPLMREQINFHRAATVIPQPVKALEVLSA
jgi:hypothetical protein